MRQQPQGPPAAGETSLSKGQELPAGGKRDWVEKWSWGCLIVRLLPLIPSAAQTSRPGALIQGAVSLAGNGEQAGALSTVSGCVFQDAGRPAKPREDPLDDYQEDQEQEIVRHQGSSSFPLWCGVTWVCWQPGAGEDSAFRDSSSASACSVRSPEQTWSPLLPFPGVQSTLCAPCLVLLSVRIHLQQLSCGILPKQQLGGITGRITGGITAGISGWASAARPDQCVSSSTG